MIPTRWYDYNKPCGPSPDRSRGAWVAPWHPELTTGLFEVRERGEGTRDAATALPARWADFREIIEFWTDFFNFAKRFADASHASRACPGGSERLGNARNALPLRRGCLVMSQQRVGSIISSPRRPWDPQARPR